MASISFLRDRRQWRVRYRATDRKAVNNRVFSGSRSFTEKAAAFRFMIEIEQQEKQWRGGLGAPAESIETVLADFFRHCGQHTQRTQDHYKVILGRFMESLPDRVQRVAEIHARDITEYRYRLREKGLINRTLNNHLTAIKSFCRFFSERLGVDNPASSVKMLKEDPPKVHFLTSEEYQKALDAASPIDRDRITWLANTGLRAGEFSQAVNGLPVSFSAVTIVGKGRRQRTIPLNALAREVRPRLKPATPVALFLMCRRTARKARIEQFGPHSLRHYFATQLLLRGVPMIKVSMLLGHASVTTTERHYAHILSADLARVTDVLLPGPATEGR
jgi:site-specific recombinase XerD